MRRLAAALLAICAVAGLGYLVRREYVHAGDLLVPAVITSNMDAATTLSPGIVARAERLIRGAPPLADRPKLIALTFDDGPYPIFTPLLLDELDALHVPATYFLIGHDAEQFPELARRVVASGGEIANHTMTHPDLKYLSPAAIRMQLVDSADVLHRYTSAPSASSMMRPPGGQFTLKTIEAIQRDGYNVILWNDDPGDWEGFTPAEMLQHIERRATAPEILLFHSGILATIEMLPDLVHRYRSAGYRFVTVGELLARAGVAAVNDPARQPL